MKIAGTLSVTMLISFAFFGLALAQAPTPAAHVIHGALGPISAGLPVLAIGYGLYWLMKRRRIKDREIGSTQNAATNSRQNRSSCRR